MVMLAALKSFFSELTDGKKTERFADNDYRLAAAALLVHAASADGVLAEVERAKLTSLLSQRFALTQADAEELMAEATEAEHQAIDLYQFTRLLERNLDEAGRRRMIEMLWDMVAADGRINEFEDNLIWRVADLLHVPARERVELRRRIAGGLGPYGEE